MIPTEFREYTKRLPPLLTFFAYCQQQQQQQQQQEELVTQEQYSPDAHVAAAAVSPQAGETPAACCRGGRYYDDLYRYVFDTPSTALADLTSPASLRCVAALWLVLRFVAKRPLVRWSRRLGRRLARRTHGRAGTRSSWEQQNSERLDKFGEYGYRFVCHAALALYGTALLPTLLFANRNDNNGRHQQQQVEVMLAEYVFRGYPHHPVQPSMTIYYQLEAVYHVDALITLLERNIAVFGARQNAATPRRRRLSGDFFEMLLHHVVTNGLIFGSSYCRFTRIGCMVFWIHDVSDVFVDLTKMAHYLQWKWRTFGTYLVMLAVWVYTRMYLFPFVLVRTIWDDLVPLLSPSAVTERTAVVMKYLFCGLLGTLIGLHTFWFGLFMKMLFTFTTKRECHDYSEHKKGE